MDTSKECNIPLLAKRHIDAAEGSSSGYIDATTPSTTPKELQGERFLQWNENLDTMLWHLSVIREQVKTYRHIAHDTSLRSFAATSILATLKTLYGPQNQLSQVLVIVEETQDFFAGEMLETMGFRGVPDVRYNLGVIRGCLTRYMDRRNVNYRSLLGGQNELNTTIVTVEEAGTLVRDMKEQMKGGALKELLGIYKEQKRENDCQAQEIKELKERLRKALGEQEGESNETADTPTREALENWELCDGLDVVDDWEPLGTTHV
ncbi:hypothetical protein BU16DRAFT_536178 [Lophium mytilinum]|uniref:Uncharacterized protein n=1 Tax=Lophium mytilinum TaxID=390894 RepID=A0A6A6R539_9PEZI|nr:hypothetical protein BU16DRAFT_536178 [Lophium mytilinum]